MLGRRSPLPAPARRLSVELRSWAAGGHCVSGVVQNVIDAAAAVQKYGLRVVEDDARVLRSFDRGLRNDGLTERAVHTDSPGVVGRHGVADLVRGVAVDAAVLPGGLIRRVVRHFRLIKIDSPAVSV